MAQEPKVPKRLSFSRMQQSLLSQAEVHKSRISFDSPVSERRRKDAKHLMAVSSTPVLHDPIHHSYQHPQQLHQTPNMLKFQNTSPIKAQSKRLWTSKKRLPELRKKKWSVESIKREQRSSVSPSQGQSLPNFVGVSRNHRSPVQIEDQLNFNPQASQTLDNEDLKHNVQQLKISKNEVLNENIRLKTANVQLEQLIQQLYRDLNQQQQEIQEIFAGKPASAQFLQSSIMQGLKRQLRQERISRKELQEKLNDIKRSQKDTAIVELQAQLEAYQNELVRLRTLLEQQMKKGTKTQTQQQFYSIERERERETDEVTKARMKTQKDKLQEQSLQLDHLQSQVQSLKAENQQLQPKPSSKRDKSSDLQMKKQKLKVKELKASLKESNLKASNYDFLKNQNELLHQQVKELTESLKKHTNLPIQARQSYESLCKESPRLISRMQQNSIISQPNLSGSGHISEQISLHVPQSFVKSQISGKSSHSRERQEKIQILQPPFLNDEPLSTFELLVNGIKIFKSIHDYFAFLPSAGDPMPQQLYFIYEKEIKDLLSKTQGVKVSSKLLQRVYEDKQIKFTSQNLVEQTHQIVSRWSQFTDDEIQVCALVLKTVIPCIRKDFRIDVNMLSEMVEMQMSQQSEEEWLSQQKQANKTPSDPVEQEEMILQEMNSDGEVSLRQPAAHRNAAQPESVATQGAQEESNEAEITEDQMLETAEGVLRRLADIFVRNGHTVASFFQQVCTFQNSQPSVSYEDFMGKLYELGIRDLNQLQIACLMRVLGKQELNSTILLNELTNLLENFGVPQQNQNQLQGQGQIQESIVQEESFQNQHQSEHVSFIEVQQPVNFDLQHLERRPTHKLHQRMESVAEESKDGTAEQSLAGELNPERSPESTMRNLFRLKIAVKKPSQASSSEQSVSARSEQTKKSGEQAPSNLVKSKSAEKIKETLPAPPTNFQKHKTVAAFKKLDYNSIGDSSPGVLPAFFQQAAMKVHRNRRTYMQVASMLNERDMFSFRRTSQCSQLRSSQNMRDASSHSMSYSGQKTQRRPLSFEKESDLSGLFRLILNKVTKNKFMEECYRKCYNQRIKSTSGDKYFQAQLIKEDEFMHVMANALQNPFDWRPPTQTLKQLREQVYLSPKYEKIYNLKLIHQLVNDFQHQFKKQQQA